MVGRMKRGLNSRRKCYKLNIDEALAIAKEILLRGQDVELRSIKGKEVLVYEVNKTARRPPALDETGG